MSDKQIVSRLVANPNLTRRREVVHAPIVARPLPQPTPRPHNTPGRAGGIVVPPRRPPTPRPPTRRVQHVNPPLPDGDNARRIAELAGRGQGRVLVIVGNGPSLSEVDLTPLKHLSVVDIMSINKPHPQLWPTAYWAFCDPSQYRRHTKEWSEYNDGVIINSMGIKEQKHNSIRVRNLGGEGFSRDLLQGFYVGRSTVYANMQTAYWMDYQHVYIFACDMNPDGLDGKLWFYGVNPDVPPALRRTRFEAEARHYDVAATQLDEGERARYTFCSAYNPWPFVDWFNRMDHREAVALIEERHGKS